jgi:hypothetical protein
LVDAALDALVVWVVWQLPPAQATVVLSALAACWPCSQANAPGSVNAEIAADVAGEICHVVVDAGVWSMSMPLDWHIGFAADGEWRCSTGWTKKPKRFLNPSMAGIFLWRCRPSANTARSERFRPDPAPPV